MTRDEYLHHAAQRMAADGSAVSHAPLGRFDGVIGYRGEVRLRWFATKLHTFTILAAVPTAREEDLRELIGESLSYAKAAERMPRGLQMGVAVIPVLVASSVEPAAQALAEAPPERAWRAFARPAVVDVTSSQTFTYHGRTIWGGVYNSWLRERRQAVTIS